jgi:hypothetical protein
VKKSLQSNIVGARRNGIVTARSNHMKRVRSRIAARVKIIELSRVDGLLRIDSFHTVIISRVLIPGNTLPLEAKLNWTSLLVGSIDDAINQLLFLHLTARSNRRNRCSRSNTSDRGTFDFIRTVPILGDAKEFPVYEDSSIWILDKLLAMEELVSIDFCGKTVLTGPWKSDALLIEEAICVALAVNLGDSLHASCRQGLCCKTRSRHSFSEANMSGFSSKRKVRKAKSERDMY